MKRFYLAGRYGRRKEILGYAADLVQRGHGVTSRWLGGGHQADELDAGGDGDVARWPLDQARRFAQDDIEDVMASDSLIAFTEAPRSTASRGGRHVEFGMALCWRLASGVGPLVVIGPRENVFHCLPEVDVFPDWPAFLHHLDTGLYRAGDVARSLFQEAPER